MKIHTMEQGTQEWREARCGIPTASEFDALVTPLGKVRTGEGVKSYIAAKVAEWWGGPLPHYISPQMEQGMQLEDEARSWAAFEFGWRVERVGLITTDCGRYGCSPDGVSFEFANQFGLEIKAPQRHTHAGYVLADKLPAEYVAQVQGGLWVTGFAEWVFVSYCRQMPPLVKRVQPWDEYQNALTQALAEFSERFEEAKAQMIKANGGEPPPKRVPMVFSDDIRNGRAPDPEGEVVP